MRAAALDFEMVRLCGLRANRVIATAFAVSGLLAGLACIFIMARRGSVLPHMGFDPVLTAFVACVIGGFGSLPGAVLGGFLLGAVEVAVRRVLALHARVGEELGVQMPEMDLGGGFGIAYTTQDDPADPADLAAGMRAIASTIPVRKKAREPRKKPAAMLTVSPT